MSAAANMRHGAASDNDGASVHEDRAISTTRQCLTTDMNTTMGATLKATSPAALSKAANNQHLTELTIHAPQHNAHSRQAAGPIEGSGSSVMNSKTPRQQRTTAYSAAKQGMNNACANVRREHRLSTLQGNDIMCMTVFVVPGDEDFHNMIVKHTYRQDVNLRR